jgi:hypothetical protein
VLIRQTSLRYLTTHIAFILDRKEGLNIRILISAPVEYCKSEDSRPFEAPSVEHSLMPTLSINFKSQLG